MRLQSALRIAHNPDTFFRTFNAGMTVVAQPVLDLEARLAEADRTVDRYVVAEPRRAQETRARTDERKSREFELPEHFKLADAERTFEQPSGGRVEDLEIARVENNARGVAVAPFDADLVGVGEGGHVARLVRDSCLYAYASEKQDVPGCPTFLVIPGRA